MKRNFGKTIAFLLTLALLLTSIMLPMSLIVSADSGDIDYSNFSGRQTWKFDTAPENEDFQINMLNAAVDTANGYFYAPTNWTQNQPVNYEFKNGKTYVVNIKWKVSAKPSGGIKFYLRYGTSAAGYNAIGSSTSWIATPPTDWRTDRYQFTATKAGLLNVYMDAGEGETLFIDTISVYEVGSSVKFDFSDDTQLKAKYDNGVPAHAQFTSDDTLSALVEGQWKTENQFMLDYLLENGKKYTVTYRYKADAVLTSNTCRVTYNTGSGAWDGYNSADGFASPDVTTAKANTWYTGSFTFTAGNDDTHPYIGFSMRGAKVATYEFDDITISQTSGTVILDTMDGNTEEAMTAGIKAGSNFTLPTPRRAGYSFVAWYTEPELINAVTSVTVPAENQSVTVYAKWEVATSYFLDFSSSNDLEFGTSYFGGSGCNPQILNGELYFRGSSGTNPSYARLPIVLEAATYKYSFKYKANPANEGDTYSLYMNAGSNLAKTNNEFNNAYNSAKAEKVFNTATLSTGNEYVTVSGTFTVTDDMISDTANRLTLRYATKAEGDLLYIDDFSFEKVITRTYDFSDASQVGNAYDAQILDEELVMSANAGQQSRARLDCELSAGRTYILSYRYKANKAMDVKLTPWYAKSVETYNNWYFCGGDNESEHIIPGMSADYFYVTTDWQIANVQFTANGTNNDYKYLAFRMQSSLNYGEIYIDDVVITECARTLQFNTNGGNEVADMAYLPVANSVTLPVPVKENNAFDGWFFDEQLQNAVGNTYSPSTGSPITFYAKWSAKSANTNTPEAPEVSLSNGTVTVSATQGNEYKVDDNAWQTSNEFTGLVVGPEYTFAQRIAETGTVSSSSASTTTTFKLTAKGDYTQNGDFDVDDLVGIRKNLLGSASDDISMVDANEDASLSLLDLVRAKKLVISTAKLFVGNNDIAGYEVVNNSINSFIANKASEELTNAIETFNGKTLDGTSGNTITLNVNYAEQDSYDVSVSDGNIVFTASSDYMLLNAVRAFVAKFNGLDASKVHIPNGFAMSNETVDSTTGYSLAWQDEFSGNALDTSKWMNEIYNIESGNNTIQRTCNAVSVSNGSLKLNTYKAENENIWYGADIRTTNKFTFSYGYFEIRAKLPGSGNAASFWANGSRKNGELSSNEVDVFETFGDTSEITSTVHYWTNNAHERTKATASISPDSSSVYHNYGCEWTNESVKFYIDGVLVNTILFSSNPSIYSALAKGNALTLLLANSTGYDNSILSEFSYIEGSPRAATLQVDYIRLYQIG